MKKRNRYHRRNLIASQKSKSPNGTVYDSAFEAYIGKLLFLKKSAGEFREVIHHHSTVEFCCGIKYKPDFFIIDNSGCKYYIEAKGLLTPEFRLKLRMYKNCPTSDLIALFVVQSIGYDYRRKVPLFSISHCIKANGIAEPF